MSEFVTREELAAWRAESMEHNKITDAKIEHGQSEIIAAIQQSEARINERTNQLDTRINGRIKKLEDEQKVLSARQDATEAWMRAKEAVSDFFVNKTKNPLVIFLLGIAISLGGVFIADRTGGDTTNTTTNNSSSNCEIKLVNLKVSLEGKLITKEYYEVQLEKLKRGDC